MTSAAEVATVPRGLPPGVASVIDDVVRAAKELRPARIILLGSTARGEHTYGTLAGRTELFGDIELYVTTSGLGPSRSAIDAFRARLRLIEGGTGFTNPFFHVDVGVRADRLLRARLRTDLRIPSLELLRSGRVLHGPALPEVPAATLLRRLDLGSVNEIALTRLIHQALHTPRALLAGEAGPYARGIHELALWRNVLDVPTVYLPHRGVLLASYRERAAWLRASEPEAWEGVADAQERALAAKLSLRLGEPALAYDTFLRQYAQLLTFIAGAEPARGASEALVREAAHAIERAGERPFRPNLRMRALQLRRDLRAAGASGSMRAWRLPRRSLLASTLLMLHHDIAAALDDRPPAFESDVRSRAEVLSVRAVPRPEGAPLARVGDLRSAVIGSILTWRFAPAERRAARAIVEWEEAR